MAIALFTCMAVPIAVIWVGLGAVAGSGRVVSLDPVKMQRAFALVIGVYSASIAWTTVY